MRDWRLVTRDYIDLVFDFEQHGEHLPLVGWLDKGRTMVSFPSYQRFTRRNGHAELSRP